MSYKKISLMLSIFALNAFLFGEEIEQTEEFAARRSMWLIEYKKTDDSAFAKELRDEAETFVKTIVDTEDSNRGLKDIYGMLANLLSKAQEAVLSNLNIKVGLDSGTVQIPKAIAEAVEAVVEDAIDDVVGESAADAVGDVVSDIVEQGLEAAFDAVADDVESAACDQSTAEEVKPEEVQTEENNRIFQLIVALDVVKAEDESVAREIENRLNSLVQAVDNKTITAQDFAQEFVAICQFMNEVRIGSVYVVTGK